MMKPIPASSSAIPTTRLNSDHVETFSAVGVQRRLERRLCNPDVPYRVVERPP
jgi:hypothetical protein